VVVTFAQIRVDGATSGGQANKISSHKESLEAKASCYQLEVKQVMADNFYRP